MANQAEAEILTRVLSRLLPDANAAILKLDFTAEERNRMNQLAEKARECSLTESEDEEMEAYVKVGHLLGILHSKARQATKRAVVKKTSV